MPADGVPLSGNESEASCNEMGRELCPYEALCPNANSGGCRCCELITYVGDPNCDEGSDFFNTLEAAGGSTYSYIRTPDEGGWTTDYCGSGTLTEGCEVCGSCSLSTYSWAMCDAIQPELEYGGDRTNYAQDWGGCSYSSPW